MTRSKSIQQPCPQIEVCRMDSGRRRDVTEGMKRFRAEFASFGRVRWASSFGVDGRHSSCRGRVRASLETSEFCLTLFSLQCPRVPLLCPGSWVFDPKCRNNSLVSMHSSASRRALFDLRHVTAITSRIDQYWNVYGIYTRDTSLLFAALTCSER